mmetsp:Transcript_150383/g.483279  ORF Transcript_150383/g.483279 Transcript_150383/m.483279 type:complete len:314 (-) Transcript_150383:2826-3767(-)
MQSRVRRGPSALLLGGLGNFPIPFVFPGLSCDREIGVHGQDQVHDADRELAELAHVCSPQQHQHRCRGRDLCDELKLTLEQTLVRRLLLRRGFVGIVALTLPAACPASTGCSTLCPRLRLDLQKVLDVHAATLRHQGFPRETSLPALEFRVPHARQVDDLPTEHHAAVLRALADGVADLVRLPAGDVFELLEQVHDLMPAGELHDAHVPVPPQGLVNIGGGQEHAKGHGELPEEEVDDAGAHRDVEHAHLLLPRDAQVGFVLKVFEGLVDLTPNEDVNHHEARQRAGREDALRRSQQEPLRDLSEHVFQDRGD